MPTLLLDQHTLFQSLCLRASHLPTRAAVWSVGFAISGVRNLARGLERVISADLQGDPLGVRAFGAWRWTDTTHRDPNLVVPTHISLEEIVLRLQKGCDNPALDQATMWKCVRPLSFGTRDQATLSLEPMTLGAVQTACLLVPPCESDPVFLTPLLG